MRKLRTMHLFAGAGGGILADLLLGHQPVCAVEINQYCQQVLSARQKDGCFPWFPIFADVTQFDGRPWRGVVDVVSGGFPCQDISAAGKGAGIDGERSGLWKEFARIICEVQPRFVFVENSPMLTVRGLGRVLGDLAAMGYDAEWGVLGADAVGAPHKRDRIWIVAHSAGLDCDPRRPEPTGQQRKAGTANGGDDVANAGSRRCSGAKGGEVEQPGRAEAVCTGETLADTTGTRCGEGQPGESWQVRDETWGTQPERRGCQVADSYGHDEHWRGGTLQVGRQWRERKVAADGDAARVEWSIEPNVGRKVDGLA